MKLFDMRIAAVLSITLLALNAYAGTEDDKKVIVPPETPAPSRWSISAGAAVSSIKATFQADPADVTLLDPSTAIYNGTAPQTYGNGVVGAAGPNTPGPGETSFSGSPTITRAGSTDFASVGFLSTNALAPGAVSDTELSLGGYVHLAYDAIDWDSDTLHLSPFLQYTFTTAFDSGGGAFPGSTTNIYYLQTSPLLGTNTLRYAPPQTAPNGLTYPYETTSLPFTAGYIMSSVNIDMHTFTLGLDLTKDLTDRVHLVCTTGPTANLFETGLVSMPIGFPAGTVPMRSDDSTWRFGWVGQLGLQLDLDANKRWYLETSGNYHWVTPFTVSTALSSARIQASSWGAELGLGFRY